MVHTRSLLERATPRAPRVTPFPVAEETPPTAGMLPSVVVSRTRCAGAIHRFRAALRIPQVTDLLSDWVHQSAAALSTLPLAGTPGSVVVSRTRRPRGRHKR